MNCKEYRQLASAQVDGHATADEARRLAAHLADCEPCRRSERAMRAIGSALEVDFPSVSAGFKTALFDRLDDEKLLPVPRKGRLIAFPLWRWAAVPLAAAAGLALFLLVGREANERHPVGTPVGRQVARQALPPAVAPPKAAPVSDETRTASGTAPGGAAGSPAARAVPALSPEEAEIVANLDLFEDAAAFDDAPSGLDDMLAPASKGKG